MCYCIILFTLSTLLYLYVYQDTTELCWSCSWNLPVDAGATDEPLYVRLASVNERVEYRMLTMYRFPAPAVRIVLAKVRRSGGR